MYLGLPLVMNVVLFPGVMDINNLFIHPWGVVAANTNRVIKLISSLSLKYIGLGFRI